MLASLLVIAVSVAAGFGVGGWYAYAEARTATWDKKVERLKPHGGIAFLLWKIVWIVIFLAGTALPFALVFIVPFAVAPLFSMRDPVVLIASAVLALLMIAVGIRIVRKSLRSS